LRNQISAPHGIRFCGEFFYFKKFQKGLFKNEKNYKNFFLGVAAYTLLDEVATGFTALKEKIKLTFLTALTLYLH